MSELLFGQLDLRDITLVCQDWGGLIGLRLVAENSHRFARVVAANTLLPTGDQAAPANRTAWKTLPRFEKPFLTAFSDGDPITAGYEPVLRRIPGCEGQPHTTIKNGGHFLQEDQGEELAGVVNDFIARTRAE